MATTHSPRSLADFHSAIAGVKALATVRSNGYVRRPGPYGLMTRGSDHRPRPQARGA